MIIQFNNFWHALVILSAVIFSSIGVMLGILIEGQMFSIIMSGTGIVALMGVMVNHNIVLVDTFHHLLDAGLQADGCDHPHRRSALAAGHPDHGHGDARPACR